MWTGRRVDSNQDSNRQASIGFKFYSSLIGSYYYQAYYATHSL